MLSATHRHYNPPQRDTQIDFMKSFEDNLFKVEKAIQQYSGTHEIVASRADRFVQSQHTPVRRRAARDLIDCTIYITLREIRDIIEQLVLNVYETYDIGKSDTIYLYTGNPERSFYFISVLAMWAIRKHKLREPTHFVSKLDYTAVTQMKSYPILIFDDVSYSGSQLSGMLGRLYHEMVILYHHPVPNIYVMLTALNTVSLVRLVKVPTKYISRHRLPTDYIPSPFHLVFLKERMYPTMLEQLNCPERWLAVQFFFGGGQYARHISMYTDHKIADEVSTFKSALMYGPIVPMSYSSSAIFDEDALYNTYQFVDEFIDGDIHPILRNIVAKDISDNEATGNDCMYLTNIAFSPFMNNCEEVIRDIIEDPQIRKIPYRHFISGDDIDARLFVEDVSYILDIFAVQIIEKLRNAPRYPLSWYKKGELCMK
jgi:hypothetical protein